MRLANAYTLWEEESWEKETSLPIKYFTGMLKAPAGYRVSAETIPSAFIRRSQGAKDSVRKELRGLVRQYGCLHLAVTYTFTPDRLIALKWC